MKKEEASETLAADVEMEKQHLEEDQMAGEEIRKRAMETLSQTQHRNSKKDQNGPKRKVRKGGDTALAFLAEKAEKEKKALGGKQQIRERMPGIRKGKNREIHTATK